MKEFIYTWNIKNISYSWHKLKDEIKSPMFVAETLHNTVWYLSFYPKGYFASEWLSFYLHKSEDESLKDFAFDFELSCVSANNLNLASCKFEGVKAAEAREKGVGQKDFLRTHEVLVQRRHLYLHQDSLTLRCRIWRNVDIVNRYGQSLGCTTLGIERISSVEDISLRTNNKKTVFIHSNKQNKLLISFDVSIEKDVLLVETQPINTEKMKFSFFKFSVMVKNRKQCEFSRSWKDNSFKQMWKTEIKGTIGNNLKVAYEFSYSNGEISNTVDMFSTSSFKYPEFSMNCILSCIPSGRLSDCPSICKDLWGLYLKQMFCDVELKTETSSFSVHKVVLCARSPVFMAMFTNEMIENSKKCVKIGDLTDDTLEKLIGFMYTDTFEETKWDEVLHLYYSADKYQKTKLKAFCASFFIQNMNIHKVCELLMLADRHNHTDLNQLLDIYIYRNRFDIFDLPEWKEYIEKQPLRAARLMEPVIITIVRTNPPAWFPGAIDDFRSLYEKATVGDAVVLTTAESFPVQKMMICAGSQKLMDMLSSDQSSDSLKIEDLDIDTISRLLQFLHTDYLGNINLETAMKLYKAAFTYQVERLKVKCSCFFIAELDVSNASNLLELAIEYQDVKLKSLVEDFISLWDLKISVPNSSSKRCEIDQPKRMETRQTKKLRIVKDT